MSTLTLGSEACQYIMKAPSEQNLLDIFQGEWASRMPGAMAGLEAGHSPLFEDCRLQWLKAEWGGLDGQTVVELGPLEAGHSYMLEQMGVASNLAIEANVRAFLKCLVVKELLKLNRTRFLCGDFVEFFRTDKTKFDFCLASGVLYHMVNPVEVLYLIGQAADKILLWTHYFDETAIRSNSHVIQDRFPQGSHTALFQGFQHTLHRYEYLEARNQTVFWGGGTPHSHWMERADILKCLEHFGFKDIRINHENTTHPHGPCFTVLARR